MTKLFIHNGDKSLNSNLFKNIAYYYSDIQLPLLLITISITVAITSTEGPAQLQSGGP